MKSLLNTLLFPPDFFFSTFFLHTKIATAPFSPFKATYFLFINNDAFPLVNFRKQLTQRAEREFQLQYFFQISESFRKLALSKTSFHSIIIAFDSQAVNSRQLKYLQASYKKGGLCSQPLNSLIVSRFSAAGTEIMYSARLIIEK